MTKPTKTARPDRVPVRTWSDAIEKSDLPGLTRLLLFVIANRISDCGKGQMITVEELMRASGMSNRSVATHLQKAVAAGFLAMERIVDSRGFRVGTRYLPMPGDSTKVGRGCE